MFLIQKSTSKLIEVLNPRDLMNPKAHKIQGCYHAGEELQDPEDFNKEDLTFQSGEEMPLCWTDEGYRKH